MRWVTYDAGAGPRTGVLVGEAVRGLREGVSLLDLLTGDDLAEAGGDALRAPDEVRGLDGVRLLAPLPRPPSVRDALGFLDHLRGCYRALGRPDELDPAWSQTPAFYFANTGSIVGPHDDVPVAPGSTRCSTSSWRWGTCRSASAGCSKDSASTLGPALVTVDELEPHRRDGRLAFGLTAVLNGEELARGTLDRMDWTFGELVAFASRGVTLAPGDVIASGTVPGGCLLEHADGADLAGLRWLRPGDVVSLRGEGLGGTRQTVVAGRDVIPLHTGF